MAEAQSTKWILITIIYFFLMNILVISSQGIADYYEYETNYTYTNSSFSSSYNYGEFNCSSPRYAFYLSNEGILKSGREQAILYSAIFQDDECELSSGIYSQIECEKIEGCSWINQTSGWWLWETETGQQTCEGSINFTYYNGGQDLELFQNVCELSYFNNNTEEAKASCERVGCSIVSYDYASNSFSATGIWNILKDLASFQLDFNTEIPLLAIIVSFFTLYLPLILLIIQLRYILPF